MCGEFKEKTLHSNVVIKIFNFLPHNSSGYSKSHGNKVEILK